MLMLTLIVLGGAADSAITFYGIRRFGVAVETNPVIVWLFDRIGLLSSALPLAVSLAAAAAVWLSSLSAVAYVFALIFWAPVPWNAWVLVRSLRRHRVDPQSR